MAAVQKVCFNLLFIFAFFSTTSAEAVRSDTGCNGQVAKGFRYEVFGKVQNVYFRAYTEKQVKPLSRFIRILSENSGEKVKPQRLRH